jgi:hypothetical protein
MKTYLHQNYIKASNLIYLCALLGIINVFLLRETYTSTLKIATLIFTFAFIVGLGVLIRQGFEWIKYLLLFIMIFGLIGIPTWIKNLSEMPILGIINILQIVLQFWALILVFKVPKKENINKKPNA